MIRLVTLALALCFAGAACAQPVTTQFRHGPDRTGVFEGPAPGDLGRFVWRFKTGHMVVSSPTVADGVLYAGSKDGFLYALDAKTGEERWRFAADAGVTSSAAVAGGLIYVQSDANTLYALDPSGHPVWSRSLGETIAFDSPYPHSGLADYWTSSPLIDAGRLYIGSGDGAVWALDAKSGEVLWRHATEGRVRASPSTDGKRIYAGSFDGRMYALDPDTGEEVWRFQTAGNPFFKVGHIQSTAAVAGGLVIFGSRDYWIYALNAATGAVVWKREHPNSWVVASPAVSGGLVCTGGSDTQMMQCLDLATGEERWKAVIRNNIFSSAAIADGRVYVGSFMGGAVGFALKDGAFAGFNIADGRSNSSPWIEDGMLYIGSDNGHVYAFADKGDE